MKKNTVVGASFSHPHLLHLGLRTDDALKQYAELGLEHVRLGCYWDEIERTRGVYDFSELETLVDHCKKVGIEIILTIGMKAPRYPEYYIPTWLLAESKIKNNTFKYEDTPFNTALFSYITAVINHFKSSTQIKYWQIENEPLDPSGPHWWRIDRELLKREAAFVKDLDSTRPIVINLWGNELKKRNYFSHISDIADIVGLDLYPRVPGKNVWGKHVLQGPQDSDIQIQEVMNDMKNKGKQVWISELQTEPWTIPESCLPQHVASNASWIADWNVDGVFFWGFEYWYQQKQLGNLEYWNAAKKAIRLMTVFHYPESALPISYPTKRR